MFQEMGMESKLLNHIIHSLVEKYKRNLKMTVFQEIDIKSKLLNQIQ